MDKLNSLTPQTIYPTENLVLRAWACPLEGAIWWQKARRTFADRLRRCVQHTEKTLLYSCLKETYFHLPAVCLSVCYTTRESLIIILNGMTT